MGTLSRGWRSVGDAINIAASVIFAKFSRDDERQADQAAVRYRSRTGINPGGIGGMFVQREVRTGVPN